jgi:general stress protein 26
MNASPEFEHQIRQLLEGQKFAVLATLREGVLFQSLVAFAAAEDLKKLCFATGVYTRKYGNISQNARVALFVDDRRNSEGDFEHCLALTVRGTARLPSPKENAAWRRIYTTKHPYLDGFLDSPSSRLVEVSVQLYSLADSFQHVTEWQPPG